MLWTNYYSDQFVLFVALAVLQSHRDVLIRYLAEFDEVLKYANDLSGTVSRSACAEVVSSWQIDLDTTLAQAEVLFLQFRGMIQDVDAENEKNKPAEGSELRKRKGSVGATTATLEAKKEVSDDLRDLLKGFEMDHEQDSTLR